MPAAGSASTLTVSRNSTEKGENKRENKSGGADGGNRLNRYSGSSSSMRG